MKDGTAKICYRFGRTKDLNRRANDHWHGLDGFVEVIYQKMCVNHKFMEVCASTGLHKLKLDEEVVVADPDRIIAVIEHCYKSNQELCALTGACATSDAEDEEKTFWPGFQAPIRRKRSNCLKRQTSPYTDFALPLS